MTLILRYYIIIYLYILFHNISTLHYLSCFGNVKVCYINKCMQHYSTYKLGIDIDKLGKTYFDFRSKLGFRTDDKTLRDFNAICINRIPGDENSITGGNVRGLYWTYPDTTNVEEQRLEPVQEHLYTELCPEFEGTYVEEVYNPIITNVGCRMVIEDTSFHMPANGDGYITDNTKYHNFFNGSEFDRVHLVATVLEHQCGDDCCKMC